MSRRPIVISAAFITLITLMIAACSPDSAATPTVGDTALLRSTTAVTLTVVLPTEASLTTQPERTATLAPTDTFMRPTPTSGPLGGILELRMTSRLRGWLLNDERHVWVTADGAKTWTDVTPKSSEQVIESVSFVADDQARISVISPGEIGQDPSKFQLLYTHDSGRSWAKGRTPVLTGEHVAGLLYSADSQNGFYQVSSGVGAGSCGYFLLATDDGGATWETRSVQDVLQGQATTAQPLSACASGFGFLNGMTGWATGSSYSEYVTYLYRTGDGGVTWNHQALGNAANATTDTTCEKECITFPPTFFDETHGVLATQGSVAGGVSIWTTQDGGDTWRQNTRPRDYVQVGQSPHLWDINHGWIVLARANGERDLWVTSDRGETWAIVGSALPDGGLVSVDPSGVFWMAYRGSLSKSSDGGLTWQLIDNSP